MGKPRVIAETGAGQHGVATAMACAVLGLKAEVYMGSEDIERQKLNVFRMHLLGAKVHSVDSGSKTLKDAINEALRDWVTNLEETYYIIGSVVGPHPYPVIVRDFQSVIGREVKRQMRRKEGGLPDAIVACVGGGSNAMGSFHPFVRDGSREALRRRGRRHRQGQERGHPGRGTGGGPPRDADLPPAGRRRPGPAPPRASRRASTTPGSVLSIRSSRTAEGRRYVSATDDEAVRAFHLLSKKEGIIPALESAHAVAYAVKLAGKMKKDETVVVTLSGRGDKDVQIIAKRAGLEI